MRATLGGNPSVLPTGKRRQKSLHRVVVAAVLVLAVGPQGRSGTAAAIQLFNDSPHCTRENNGTWLVCDLSNNMMKDAELPTSNWDNRLETHIIGARSLIIRGQCKAEKKELRVISCQGVNARSQDDDCRVRMIMSNSSAESITNVANLLRVSHSSIKTVNLDGIEQFDFVDSTVDDLTVRAVFSKSTIITSDIRIIRSVVLEGGFNFEAQDSNIGDIQYLHYNTSNEESNMVGVRIGNVHEGGIVVSNGRLTLRNVSIGNLQSRAIRVQGKGELWLEEGRVTHASFDSVIMDGGTIMLREVELGSQGKVSFTISDTAGNLVPFIVALGRTSTTKWILIGIAIGLVIGLIISGGLFFIMRRRRSTKSCDREGMELLTNNTMTSPEPSKRPDGQQQQHQQKTNNDDEGDLYEDYDEVLQTVPPPPNAMNLLPKNPPPSLTTLPAERSEQHQETEEEEYAEVDNESDPHQPRLINSLPKNNYPYPSLNHLTQAKNQSTTAPSLPNTLPPAPPTPAKSPNLSRPPPPTAGPPLSHTTPPGMFNQPPSARMPPPPPQRMDSVKKVPAPSPSSFSDERDRLTPPPPPPPTKELQQASLGKRSFLHTESRNPLDIARAGDGGAPSGIGGRPRPPIPGNKPSMSPAGLKPTGGTFSTGEEEDIYDTLEEQ